MSTYLITYRVGDIVDIKANAAQQKGMPHKFYHGYAFFEYSYGYFVESVIDELASSTMSLLMPLVLS